MGIEFSNDELLKIYHAVNVYVAIHSKHETDETRKKWTELNDKIYRRFHNDGS